MLQRTQIECGGFAAAHQQDMAQTQPLAAAGTVDPAQNHPLKHDGGGGENVEQRQHNAGVVVQVQQIQRTNENQEARCVDNGNFGAALGQAVQPRIVVNARHPVDEHQHQRRGQPGNDVTGILRHGQGRAGTAGLKIADIIKTNIVGKQKAHKQQRCIQQHKQQAFKTLVFFQQG